MMEQTAENGRVRAWVLVHADDPEAFAQELYELLGQRGEDDYVVVRADVVNHRLNVVIPVDAASETDLVRVVKKIAGLEIVRDIAVLRVQMHIPYPPHIAHGYIDEDEFERYPEEGFKPGRQGASPGANPWG
jgi:hypothetical protein